MTPFSCDFAYASRALPTSSALLNPHAFSVPVDFVENATSPVDPPPPELQAVSATSEAVRVSASSARCRAIIIDPFLRVRPMARPWGAVERPL